MPSYATDPAEIDAEIRALPITLEPLEAPEDKYLSEADLKLVGPLVDELQRGSPRAIVAIKRLIKKYPDAPSLRNHLTVGYMAAGKTAKAFEINEQLFRDFPDYLFARLNVASHFLLDGGDSWLRVPELLGETLCLRDLKPDVEMFHFSEVRSYYVIVAHFHLNGGRLNLAHAIHTALADLMGEKEPQLLSLWKRIGIENFQQLRQRMAADEAREIRVAGRPLPAVAAEAAQPEFHHPVVGELYRHGWGLPVTMINEMLALPQDTAVADLEAVLRDGIARVGYYMAGKDDLGSFSPLHAIALLGELRAGSSLPVVFEFLSQHDDALYMWFGDVLEQVLWQPLYHLVGDQLDLAREFLCAPGVSGIGRSVVALAVSRIGLLEPGRRDEVIGWFRGVLEFLLDSPAGDGVLDSRLVTALVSHLMDLRGQELIPVVTAHFERGHVAESSVGDLEAIVHAMVEGDRAAQDRTLQSIAERYKKINRQIEREPPAAKPAGARPAAAHAKVGRNDPCPCGSGKKYKRCCLR